VNWENYLQGCRPKPLIGYASCSGYEGSRLPFTVGPAAQVRADGPPRWLRFRRDEITAAELIAAVSARDRIRDLTIEEPEIEGIVRRIHEEGL
jgi:ABC-2 type transport system ATP-binding protein